MARILLLLLLGGVIFLLVRALRRVGSASPLQRPTDDAAKGADAAAEPATMVACAYCGVHIPEPDAVSDQGYRYCCEAHRRRGPASQ